MGSIAAVSTVTTAHRLPPPPCYYASDSSIRRSSKLKAIHNHNGADNPFPQSAVYRAALRFHETKRPEPLFVDQYAGCFVSKDNKMDLENHSPHHCLATKFIDDKLLSTVKNIDGPKQVVLFTDGMDTRPYRVGWPSSTLIFDISPEIIFRKTALVLEGVGAKVRKGSLYLHIPWESSEISADLCNKGFNGSRPSVWAIQGLPLTSLESFKEILSIVSGLAMNGSLFFGELPICLAEPHINSELNTERWIDKLFMGNGFQVKLINYDDVAKNLGKEREPSNSENILFIAEQLRFSDDQMETWRKELQRIEEEGDEDGFDEL